MHCGLTLPAIALEENREGKTQGLILCEAGFISSVVGACP